MEEKKKAPLIHKTKLFGGTKTAEEVYQEIAVNRPCLACGRPGITKLATLVMLKDLQAKTPWVLRAIMAGREPGAEPPVIKTIYGPMVCLAEVVACKSCTPAAEREAHKVEKEVSAKGMTCTTEIRYGPGTDIPIFQVPGSSAE